MRAVFGTGRDDVWLGGAYGTLLRTRDGGKTFERARLDDGEGVTSIWAGDPDHVWVLGEHHVHRIEEGTSLATLSARLDNHGLGRLWGDSANDVWARSRSDVWVDVPFGVRHGTDGGASRSRGRISGRPRARFGCDQRRPVVSIGKRPLATRPRDTRRRFALGERPKGRLGRGTTRAHHPWGVRLVARSSRSSPTARSQSRWRA